MSEKDFWEGYVPEPDKRQQALDRMAENARELGLDYEPVQQEPVAFFDPQSKGFYWAKPTKVIPPVTVDVEPLPLYTSPQQPAVPDALTIADKDSADYHEGWNDCRALMLEMRKP